MEPIPGAVEEASKTTPTGYASVKGRSANAHVDGLRPAPSAPAGGELPLAFRLEGRKESCWRLRCRRSIFAADAVSMLERTSLIASSPPPRQRSSNCSRPSASIEVLARLADGDCRNDVGRLSCAPWISPSFGKTAVSRGRIISVALGGRGCGFNVTRSTGVTPDVFFSADFGGSGCGFNVTGAELMRLRGGRPSSIRSGAVSGCAASSA